MGPIAKSLKWRKTQGDGRMTVNEFHNLSVRLEDYVKNWTPEMVSAMAWAEQHDNPASRAIEHMIWSEVFRGRRI